MNDIHFRIAAKTDVGLERNNNEDNFQVSANLDESPMKWVNNQEYSLGRKGALLVVADGMGGMNAGEVASEIAINTVRELFCPENITDEIVKTRFTIEKFMKGVIVEADKRIKAFAKENPESRSMGTTIVIAWLFDGNLYVSWCGDSRAYIYNPSTGLFQITKDHSYVQDLVDAGKISKEDAFDFPDSNIITRSLSDSTPKPNPDCLLMPQKLCDNDIILLCSDGLNGMIRDQEIESIIVANQGNMTECVDALIQAALDAAGADNCTVALCQILSGGAESSIKRIPKYSSPDKSISENEGGDGQNHKTRHTLFFLSILAFCLVIGALVGWYFFGLPNLKQSQDVAKEDSTEVILPDSDSVKVASTVEDVEDEGMTSKMEEKEQCPDKDNNNSKGVNIKEQKPASPKNLKPKPSEAQGKNIKKPEEVGIDIGDGNRLTPLPKDESTQEGADGKESAAGNNNKKGTSVDNPSTKKIKKKGEKK